MEEEHSRASSPRKKLQASRERQPRKTDPGFPKSPPLPPKPASGTLSQSGFPTLCLDRDKRLQRVWASDQVFLPYHLFPDARRSVILGRRDNHRRSRSDPPEESSRNPSSRLYVSIETKGCNVFGQAAAFVYPLTSFPDARRTGIASRKEACPGNRRRLAN